ncbi:thiamine-phosphate kinase [Amphibacillus sp. Q70]|uniref:thiamine-phosphate kinase n=1 Tax=Amphibacillus sp. Q70 TaxID=3453416 RepID=UPI003F842BCA
MNEFDFINSIKQKAYRNHSIIKGIGDDAAVFRQPYQDIVTAVDTFVDGIHFSKKTMNPFQIGYRVLAANISDMAAMGADPISYMISIVVPKDWSDNDLTEIYRGLNAIALEYQLDLIGGDTVIGKQLVLSVTINGIVPNNKARYRNLMRPGDYIFVTGTLGDSAAGLDFLLKKNNEIEHTDFLLNRHRYPSPRVAFAKGLTPLDRVALNDISDGIANEANELAEASKLTIYLEENKLPISDALKQFSRTKQLDYILNGGEDFELVGSVAPVNWNFVKEIAAKTNTPVTKIGIVKNENSNGKVFIAKKDGTKLLESSGFVHHN